MLERIKGFIFTKVSLQPQCVQQSSLSWNTIFFLQVNEIRSAARVNQIRYVWGVVSGTACWPLGSVNGKTKKGKTRRVGFIQKLEVKRRERVPVVQDAEMNEIFLV